MRRLAGACVVVVMIGTAKLAGDWLVRPVVAPDSGPALVSGPEVSTPPTSPSTSAPVPRATPAPPGKIVIPSFERDPLAFLSTAPAESLDLLPGIGPVLAARIIETRATRGPFASWDDVRAVKGIGPRTVARWRAPSAGQ